ncbi:MAG: formimidoylglutamate deiminase [Candidatus Dormiibacterota bacterium]
MNGSGLWHARHAWLGHPAQDVLIEVENGLFKAVTEGVARPSQATAMNGYTIPGFANVHSHAFQTVLRGRVETGAGNFWEWRDAMFRAAAGWGAPEYRLHCMQVFGEMLNAGITAVGEFHYLHALGNDLGQAVIDAAKETGIRVTLIDACYLRGGLDGRPLQGAQRSFSDGDAERWAKRVDRLKDEDGVRIGAAIHSVRAVDPASMRTVADWARERGAPLHIHLAEQPAEVEECMAVEGCSPARLLEREGILGSDLTAVHAIHLDDDDIALLGGHRVSVCACATTERELGDRVGPLQALAGAGCKLCVGSDSNAIIDAFEEARGLELDQRRATGRRVLHQPEDLLRAATVNGMGSLGWEAGELKPGMLADFIEVVPNTEFDASGLVFGHSASDVLTVVVGGKTVVSR